MSDWEHPGDRLSALLDGELDEAEQDAVRAHVRTCPICAAELEEVAAARAAIRALPWLELPGAVVLRVRRSRRRIVLPAAFVSAAAVSFALLASVPAERSVAPPVDRFVLSSASLTANNVAAPRQFPYRAPALLTNGFRRIGVWQGDGFAQFVYSDGVHVLTVFEQAGRLAADRLPAGANAVTVGQVVGRVFDWQGERVVVWQLGSTTYTLVADDDAAEALDVARSVPPPPSPSSWQRARKAARQLLEEVSGSR
jgi:hypothetical protein